MLLARLGDKSDHGGSIVQGSFDVVVGGRGAARIGDLHVDPLPKHPNVTPIVTGSFDIIINGRGVAKVTSKTGCGATIVTGAFDVSAN